MNIFTVKGRMANTYIVEENGSIFVVDVPKGSARSIQEYISDILGLNSKKVVLILCTHDDYDHSGGVFGLADLLAARVGFPYSAHSIARKVWHNPLGLYFRPATIFKEFFHPRMWRMYVNPLRNLKYRKRQKIRPKYRKTTPVKNSPDFYFKDNEEIRGFPNWCAIHTPGHSWDSHSLFHSKTGTLITGDSILGSMKMGKLILPSVYANPWQSARTIKVLRKLNPRHIYPGHGCSFHGRHLLDHL